MGNTPLQKSHLHPQNLPKPAFLEKGCGCKRNGGKPCYTSFSREEYETSRMQCAELSWKELDLVILGQISALLPSTDSSKTTSRRPSTNRHRMSFHHHGVPICRETFLKLMLQAVWAEYKLASDEAGIKAAAYTTFVSLWRQLVPHITVMKPVRFM